jgi:hypothetical protein
MKLTKPPEPKSFATPNPPLKSDLIDKLLENRISIDQLEDLRKMISAEDLSNIIQRIYDLNEKYILNLSAVEGVLRKLNDIKNAKRNKKFLRKMEKGFRDNSDLKKKVILAEGDSWFNYPIILTDIIDRISNEKDFALYSLASGGDWLLNMLTARHYVEELSLLHPDIFLISGGGNDLVGSSRLAAILEPKGCDEYNQSKWAMQLIERARKDMVPFDHADFNEGVCHLSKDFFALLMFFHLQYSFLINGILQPGSAKEGKFKGIKIITQGYDYPIPSYKKAFGLNPLRWYVPFIRMFLGHGHWLKTPLQMRGITNEETQRKILYAMIYLFNEMMISTGAYFNNLLPQSVFHIDSRGSVGKNGWTDELHALPEHFMRTGKVFIHCIRKEYEPTYSHVYIVNKFYPNAG